MPFQSEKQRRYMHANLPRIAKRWERDYANGGIASQGGMKNYLGEQPMVNAPQNWRSGPDSPPTELAYITQPEKELILRSNIHGSLANGPNEGPSGIMSLDGWGDKEQGFGMSDTGQGITGTGGHSFGDQERSVTTTVGSPRGPQTVTRTVSPKDTFKQSWSGQPGFLGFGGGYRNLRTPGVTPERGGAYQSRFGLGSLLRGAASMFGGWPGKIGSMLSRIDPRQLRGKNPDGSWRTQQQYEDARQGRRDQKRMGYLSDRKSRGLGYGTKAYANLLGRGIKDPFQEALNRDLQINPETTPFTRSHLQSLANKQALTNQLSANNYNFHPSQGGIMSTPQGMDFAGARRAMTQPGLDKFRPMTDQQVQKYGQLSTQNINRGVYDPYGIRTPSGAFSYDMNYNNNVPMDPYADIEGHMSEVTRSQYNTLKALGQVGNTGGNPDEIKEMVPAGTFDSIQPSEWEEIFQGKKFKDITQIT